MSASPTAQEQLLIELINRARMDPAGEAARYGIDLNQGLAPGTLSAAPLAPLAGNALLHAASAGQSVWMLRSGVFSHTGRGGSAPWDRFEDEGYRWTAAGENIVWRGTTGGLDPTAAVLGHHRTLFLSAAHRENILGEFREIGVAQAMGRFQGYNASLVTEGFASAAGRAFVTGVAYTDRDGDRFYDAGEGRSGVRVDWLGDRGGAVATAAAGGYAVAVPLGLEGAARVAVAVGGATINATLTMDGGNAKLDVIGGRILAASESLALGAGARDGLLLGIEDLRLVGNGAANRLVGNRGDNVVSGGGGDDALRGGAGDDMLFGGAGDDRFTGGSGRDTFAFVAGGGTGDDVITDLAAGDRLRVDVAGAPREAAWIAGQAEAEAGGWRLDLGDGASVLVLGVGQAALADALVLA